MGVHQLISLDPTEEPRPQGLGLLGLPDDVLARPRPSKLGAFARAALGLVQKLERDLAAEQKKPAAPAQRPAALAAPAPAPAQAREKQPWESEIERDQNSKRSDHLEEKFRKAAGGKFTKEQLDFSIAALRQKGEAGAHVEALVLADDLLASSQLPPLE